MKTILLYSFFLGVTLLQSKLFAMPAQILLIRHAEKPLVGNELSTQGWDRAKILPKMFESRSEFNIYGKPAALFAMKPTKHGSQLRAVQTLKYLSHDLKLKINSDFQRDQVTQLVSSIKNNHNLDGKMVVICWEHAVLVDIAHEFGAQNHLKWPGRQFDRVWSMSFSADGKLKKFDDIPEKLLPSDSKI